MSNWSTPQQCLNTIQAGDASNWAQSENRRRINAQANGAPPLDEKTAKDIGLKVNVNWGELIVPLAHARRSYEDAVIGQERYFKASLPYAPAEKQTEWGLSVTNYANDLLKEDEDIAPELDCLHQYRISALVCHGVAPCVWYRDDDILPEFVELSDFRVPTDATTSFKRMEWFAVRHLHTPGELYRRALGENTVPGWNRQAVRKIMTQYHNVNYAEVTYTWETAPEKMEELIKQNLGYYSSDAMPTVPLWYFYFQDSDGGNNWYLKVVPDRGTQFNIGQEEFLFESDKPVADRLSHLLHVQFGDINNAAPFLVHSVRSLGFMLMDPTFWSNLTRCRVLQHLHEHMNVWLRVISPSGRERAQKIELYDKAVIPEGVSIVPQTERHQIDKGLVDTVMAGLKQLQMEASASYTHELDTGTQKEQTATETMANLQRVNAMMSGLLGRFFRREKYFCREIARRMCLKNTTNPKAREFQSRCRIYGKIPESMLNVDLWRVEPEKPIGNGNPTMALLMADKMMAVRPMLGPDAQQQVLHDAVATYLNDPRRAAGLVPIDKAQGITSGTEFAQSLFGTLMQGVPVQQKEGLSPIDQINTLLGLMAGKCAQVQKQGGTTDANTIAGLQAVGQFVASLIQQLAQDENQKQLVKQFSDDLGGLMNEVKAFAQRLAESQQQMGGNGEGQAEVAKVMAQLQGKMMMDKTKAQATEFNQAQKRRHKETAFAAEQRRKDASVSAEIQRGNLRAVIEAQNMRLKAFAQRSAKPSTGNE